MAALSTPQRRFLPVLEAAIAPRAELPRFVGGGVPCEERGVPALSDDLAAVDSGTQLDKIEGQAFCVPAGL